MYIYLHIIHIYDIYPIDDGWYANLNSVFTMYQVYIYIYIHTYIHTYVKTMNIHMYILLQLYKYIFENSDMTKYILYILLRISHVYQKYHTNMIGDNYYVNI